MSKSMASFLYLHKLCKEATFPHNPANIWIRKKTCCNSSPVVEGKNEPSKNFHPSHLCNTINTSKLYFISLDRGEIFSKDFIYFFMFTCFILQQYVNKPEKYGNLFLISEVHVQHWVTIVLNPLSNYFYFLSYIKHWMCKHKDRLV